MNNNKTISGSEWTVYILHCADESFYTGIAKNLDRRLKAHEMGKGAKYTRGRKPFKVVYIEVHQSRSAASKRENQIKLLNREDKIDLITKYKLRCHYMAY